MAAYNCQGRICTMVQGSGIGQNASDSYKAAEAERQRQAERFAGQAERCGVGGSNAVGRMVDTALSFAQALYWVGEHALTGSVSEPFVGYDVLHRGSGHMTQGADALQFMFEHPVAAGVEAGKALINPTAEGLCDAAVSAGVPGGSGKMLKSGRRAKGKSGDGDEGAFVMRDGAAIKAAIKERTRKAREWADESWDDVQELPPGNEEGLAYHGYSDSNLDGIADNGLLSGEALGRAPGENASNIWFKQGDTFYYDQPNLAISTDRLGALGGVPRAGLAGQPGVIGIPHSTLPTGIPFDQLAVVFPAGNGYVIPIHIPPGWAGPPFPVPPGWPGF